MTVLLVLGAWLLLAVICCALFSAVMRGGRTLTAEGKVLPQGSVPVPRAHAATRSTVSSG